MDNGGIDRHSSMMMDFSNQERKNEANKSEIDKLKKDNEKYKKTISELEKHFNIHVRFTEKTIQISDEHWNRIKEIDL